jgi:hypothetical protein
MPHPPKPDPRLRRCKIKRVNPAVRSVSTPRSTKDLPVVGPVNPGSPLAGPSQAASASDWDAERLCERLRFELDPGAWERLVQAANRRGATLEQLLQDGLSEVA